MVANDWEALTKFRMFPIRAIPSTPIKTAIALDVIMPAKILTPIFTVLSWATFTRTKLLIYLIRSFN